MALGLTVAMTGSPACRLRQEEQKAAQGIRWQPSESGRSGNENAKVELEHFSTKTENADILQQMIDGFMEKNPDIKITLYVRIGCGNSS